MQLARLRPAAVAAAAAHVPVLAAPASAWAALRQRPLHSSASVTARVQPRRTLPPSQRGAKAMVPVPREPSQVAPSQGAAPPAYPPPPPAPGGGGLMQVVAEGFSFGIGSAIARSLVDSMFGGGGDIDGGAADTPLSSGSEQSEAAPPADTAASRVDDGSGGDDGYGAHSFDLDDNNSSGGSDSGDSGGGDGGW
jgi:hypothetical protein